MLMQVLTHSLHFTLQLTQQSTIPNLTHSPINCLRLSNTWCTLYTHIVHIHQSTTPSQYTSHIILFAPIQNSAINSAIPHAPHFSTLIHPFQSYKLIYQLIRPPSSTHSHPQLVPDPLSQLYPVTYSAIHYVNRNLLQNPLSVIP